MSDSGSEDDSHSMWSRPFNFAGRQVRVEEGWGVGIGGTVWEGGVLLAQYLSSTAFAAERYQGARCLELGAGATGLPGIVAAQLGCFSQVVITDVNECLEALHENVSANLPCHCTLAPECLPQWQTAACTASDTQPCTDSGPACLGTDSNNSMQNPGQPANHIHQHQDNADSAAQQHTDRQLSTVQATEVLVAELDWACDASALSLPFDVVLLADVVYVPEAMQSLLECIHATSGPSSLILLAYYKRFAQAGEQFWKLLPDYFDFEKILEATFGAKAQPENLGLFKLTWKAR
ncbi:hypothetical protein WJX77_010391 [Trebouxia sp. C0004]